MNLALSLFPGLGAMDLAFQETGWCVLRGPDVVWQGDVVGWHVPAGHFDGVFGGPPCQEFSLLQAINDAKQEETEKAFGNLIPEFERIVFEAQPAWYLMENVMSAPLPSVDGYQAFPTSIKDSDVGGHTIRERRFTLGLKDWPNLYSPWALIKYDPSSRQELAITHDLRVLDDGTVVNSADRVPAGSQRHRMPPEDMLELQGLPRDYLDESPYTQIAKRYLIGNAVPLAMGRAVAGVVRAALDSVGPGDL